MSGKPNATVRIEVFRPGTFTPMEGQSISYSAADLKAAADAYDKETAPAPVVVGHPSTDAPAYAWAEAFEWDGIAERLYADVGDINPSFAEAVRKGAYRKVSLSFHRPDSPANPVPGAWYPKHIGFLGGAAPAVTGLKNVQFAAGGEAVTFVADFAGVPVPQVPAPANRAPSEAAFAEREAAFAAKEAEFAAERAAWQKKEQKFAHLENASFTEKLISEGRMLPAHRERIVSILDAAAVSPVVSFAEGEQPVPMLEALRDVLKEMPVVISFGALDLGPDPEETARPSLAIPSGYTIDPKQTELYNRARQFEREKGVSFAEAVDMVAGR